MSKIFVGLLLVFLDINFTFNTTTIGLLPDFIGYFILIGGLAEMAAVNSHFGKARPFAIAMAIYTLILYILDLIGLSAALGYAATILGLLSTLISLYLSYHIVRGVMEIEDAQARSPVSYTHLDVYKRQLYRRIQSAASPAEKSL